MQSKKGVGTVSFCTEQLSASNNRSSHFMELLSAAKQSVNSSF